MKILIDNGHGENTPGKRSPDGSLREYAYAREIANRIAHELSARGYDAERIVRETVDVPLSERARRVNEVCGRYGTANVVLVSIIFAQDVGSSNSSNRRCNGKNGCPFPQGYGR